MSRQLNTHSWSLRGLSYGVRKLGSVNLQMTFKALRMDKTVTRDEGSTESGTWVTVALGSHGARRPLYWRMRITEQGYKGKHGGCMRSNWQRVCGWQLLSALMLLMGEIRLEMETGSWV